MVKSHGIPIFLAQLHSLRHSIGPFKESIEVPWHFGHQTCNGRATRQRVKGTGPVGDGG